jgi:urocanate hydratase
MPSESLQSQTLRAFTVLHQLHQNWGGALILNIGLNLQGAALALASNIAGAVCLTFEEDPATARASLRSGAADFVVNTLDEALRAIKNEIRQHRPLSVALQGDLVPNLEELLERGVAPQLFCSSATTIPNYAHRFQSTGALIIDLNHLATEPKEPDTIVASTLINTFSHDRHWTTHEFHFPDSAALRSFDAQATTILPSDDTFRRTWLTSAPRLFTRERPPTRVLWLTESERAHLEKSQKIEGARQ